jgi:hypothetical protein
VGTFTPCTDPEVQEIQPRSVLLPESEPKTAADGWGHLLPDHDSHLADGADWNRFVAFPFWRSVDIKWADLTANAIALALSLLAPEAAPIFQRSPEEIMHQSIQTKTYRYGRVASVRRFRGLNVGQTA